MNSTLYEPHYYKDPKLPILFHYDQHTPDRPFPPHWHENPELLCFTHGSANAILNMHEVRVQAGDSIMIPSNALHQIIATSASVEYYCLIIDRTFCATYGLDPTEAFYQTKVSDPLLLPKFMHIEEEFRDQSSLYQSEILSTVISLLVYLARKASAPNPLPLNKTRAAKVDIVKRAFTYIDTHFAEPISINTLSQYTGFSPSYFCHVFKDVTAMTPISYLNYVRCRHAHKLLATDQCDVSEAALLCGYENLSYFSKVYKNNIGELPSHTAKSSVESNT